MKLTVLILLLSSLFLFISHISAEDVPTFTDDDLKKYGGKSSRGIWNSDQSQIPRQTSHEGQRGDLAQEQANKSNRKLSDAEKNDIISQCTQVWHRYRNALSRGDIEGALKEVSSSSIEAFRETLLYGRKPGHFGEIRAADIEENIAQFNMTVKDKLRPGDDLAEGHSVGDYIEFEHYVNFIKEPTGAWKIDFY
ncbi:MAG TPA: hypothetical protein VMU21_00840 [Thermodesulfovibrionales bacterium]|nr:hypothetical protein [Thermodesulfovibrionales bacterium]